MRGEVEIIKIHPLGNKIFYYINNSSRGITAMAASARRPLRPGTRSSSDIDK